MQKEKIATAAERRKSCTVASDLQTAEQPVVEAYELRNIEPDISSPVPNSKKEITLFS
jgi:hypothetical protein